MVEMSIRNRFEHANRFIMEHTKVAWLMWVVLGVVLTPAFAEAPIHKATRYGWMAWLTVYIIVTTPLAIGFLQRAVRRTGRHLPMVTISWIVAQAPWLCAGAALFDRAPQWLGVVSFAEAIALMWLAIRNERQTHPQS